jgi:hypothetical protein
MDGAAPAAGEAQEAHIRLDGSQRAEGAWRLCTAFWRARARGLLLKAGKGVMTMANRVLRRGNVAGHCKMQTLRGHGALMKCNPLLKQAS